MYKFVKIKPPFDIRKNFWEENFQVSLIEPFKDVYDNDKSKNKEASSRTLWCIWLSEDPSYDNKIYRLPIDQKKSAILAYNPDFDFKDPIIAKCLLEYNGHCLSPAAKAFKTEEASLSKRAEFIDNAQYTFPEALKDKNGAIVYASGKPIMMPGTAREIDSMRKLTLDIHKKYEQVRKMFEEEQAEIRLYGGGRESAIEAGNLVMIDDED